MTRLFSLSPSRLTTRMIRYQKDIEAPSTSRVRWPASRTASGSRRVFRGFLVFSLIWVVLALSGPAQAQSVEAQTEAERQAGEPYFHEAAQHYVARQKQQALQAVESGLRVAPNHPKLLALKNKLENQPSANPDQSPGESDQKGRQQQDNAQSQPNGQPQQGNDNASQTGNQPSPGPDGESGQQGPPGQPESDPGDAQNPDAQSGNDGNRPSPNPPPGAQNANDGRGEPSERPGERLSREQAERILQALEGQEKQLLREVQEREARPRRVEKDW